ncbi:MAG: hypothetical protein HY348_11800 [Nitrospira defluvii]|nr:hypothetical protein [Nitrospira defluvii]
MTSSASTTQRINQATEQDPRWAAIVARDRAADGTFYEKPHLNAPPVGRG